MTGLLAVIYLVPQPDDLSHSEGDGGRVGLQEGRGMHRDRGSTANFPGSPTGLCWTWPGPWLHTRVDPALSRAEA